MHRWMKVSLVLHNTLKLLNYYRFLHLLPIKGFLGKVYIFMKFDRVNPQLVLVISLRQQAAKAFHTRDGVAI